MTVPDMTAPVVQKFKLDTEWPNPRKIVPNRPKPVAVKNGRDLKMGPGPLREYQGTSRIDFKVTNVLGLGFLHGIRVEDEDEVKVTSAEVAKVGKVAEMLTAADVDRVEINGMYGLREVVEGVPESEEYHRVVVRCCSRILLLSDAFVNLRT